MIIYRHPDKAEPPPWLAGGYTRADTTKGPIFTRRADGLLEVPEGLDWREVEDGWTCAAVGDVEPESLLREWVELDDGARRVRLADGQTALVYPANDARGRTWFVPMVIHADGSLAMSLPWGENEEGQAERRPTPLQASIIHAAEQAQAEVETMDGVAQLPMAVAFGWCADLLMATHFLSRRTILALGLLDDYLVARVLMGASGWGTPDHPFEEVA